MTPPHLLLLSTLTLLLPSLAIVILLVVPRAARHVLSMIWLQYASHMTWSLDLLAHADRHSCQPLPAACMEHVKLLYRSKEVVRYAGRVVSEEERVECPCCLSEVEEGDEVRELTCGHTFHRECLDRWVEHGLPRCPLCREWLAALPPLAEAKSAGAGLSVEWWMAVVSTEGCSWPSSVSNL